MKFLLQEDTLLDFIFALKKSKEWYDWWQPKAFPPIVEFVDSGCSKEICPVGSLEFCLDYYKKLGIELKPMNVPENLFHLAIGGGAYGGSVKNVNFEEWLEEVFTKRGYTEEKKYAMRSSGRFYMFIKSESKFKWPGNGLYNTFGDFLNSPLYDPSDRYQITSYYSGIEDEWRVFVFDKKVIGIKRYFSEDCLTINPPDRKIIDEVVNNVDLPAYSFDLCVLDRNKPNFCVSPDSPLLQREKQYITRLVEVHDFFSTGLYGFDDYSKLPYMFYRSHLHKFL